MPWAPYTMCRNGRWLQRPLGLMTHAMAAAVGALNFIWTGPHFYPGRPWPNRHQTWAVFCPLFGARAGLICATFGGTHMCPAPIEMAQLSAYAAILLLHLPLPEPLLLEVPVQVSVFLSASTFGAPCANVMCRPPVEFIIPFNDLCGTDKPHYGHRVLPWGRVAAAHCTLHRATCNMQRATIAPVTLQFFFSLLICICSGQNNSDFPHLLSTAHPHTPSHTHTYTHTHLLSI